jgi:hypothetical protein
VEGQCGGDEEDWRLRDKRSDYGRRFEVYDFVNYYVSLN